MLYRYSYKFLIEEFKNLDQVQALSIAWQYTSGSRGISDTGLTADPALEFVEFIVGMMKAGGSRPQRGGE